MNSIALSGVTFGCIFGGAILGLALGRTLPRHHLSADSKDIVRLSAGLVGSMTALVLGLLVASAKSGYDADKLEVVQISAKLILIDRMLASYGEEAQQARADLRRAVEMTIDRMWPAERAGHAQLDPAATPVDGLYREIAALRPGDEAQRTLKGKALDATMDLGQMRWLLYEQSGSSISTVFLTVVISWLTITFISFGMFAPTNATVTAALLVAALSVSCALFLIFELDQPFDGMIRIPSTQMRSALAHLDR